MQKFYNIAFSYEEKTLKKHKCDVSIDFEGDKLVYLDSVNNLFDPHQMAEVDDQECFIFFNFDKFYILEQYKKRKFKYLVFCLDQEKEKANKNELQDFAFALFSGIIFENFE